MKKYKLILLLFIVISTTTHSQEKYVIIISEKYAFEENKTIDKPWQKTFDEAYDFVFKQNIPFKNIYVFFCDGIDYQYAGIYDRYNAEIIFMHHLTDYPAQIENIRNFFHRKEKEKYYKYDYPIINKNDSLFVSVITNENTENVESISLYKESSIKVVELIDIINTTNANLKIEIK